MTRIMASLGLLLLLSTVVPGQTNDRDIAIFDSAFQLSNEQMLYRLTRNLPMKTDSVISGLEKPYKDHPSLYFSEYRRYRYGILKMNEARSTLEDLSVTYLGPVIRKDNPAFMDLFSALFKDFILFYSQSTEGKPLQAIFSVAKDPVAARETLLQHGAIWCDTLADMILLEAYPSLYYKGHYPADVVLPMLDSMIRTPLSPELGKQAADLKNELTSLMAGYPPPAFELKDLEGTEFSEQSFMGKYTYLFFGTPEHYGCMMEYPFLQSYADNHSDYLEVISIMDASEPKKLEDFMERNAYSWKVLLPDEEKNVLKDYRIRAYPMAFLVGPDGKLLLSPAPLPSDGFEKQLFQILRSKGEI